MSSIKYSIRSFFRNYRVSLLAVAVVCLSALFLMLFSDSISTYQANLWDSYSDLKVTTHIASSDAATRPRLSAKIWRAITETGFLVEPSLMADHMITLKDVLRGVDGTNIDPALRDCVDLVEWKEGYDASIFQSNDPVCLVPDIGQIEYGEIWSCQIGRTKYSFTIAGIYSNRLSNRITGKVVYCPLDTLETIYAAEGMEVYYSGMESQLQNLAELDYFKKEMKKLKLDSGDTIMIINDSQFQTVTSQLKRQVRLLETLLPVLLVLITAISFGSSFLLFHGRNREAAVLRSLGARRLEVFKAFLYETFLQAVLGLFIGCTVSWFVLGSGAMQPQYLAMLWISYLLGGAVAAWNISGVNMFNIMYARE